MDLKATNTGILIAKARALIMCFPRKYRTYQDSISIQFLPFIDRLQFRLLRIPFLFNLNKSKLEKTFPGLLGYYYGRFRFFNEVASNQVINKGVKSVVILGAGMDTKAYTIDNKNGVQYFEVDHPDVIKIKKEKIKSIFGKLPDNVKYVPVDFNSMDTCCELIKTGYKPSDKTLFIWESVSVYLDKQTNEEIFKFIAKSAKGSSLLFSYATDKFIAGEMNDQLTLNGMYQTQVKKAQILIQGYNSSKIENYLTNFSLKTCEHLGKSELLNKYNTFNDLKLDIAEVERFIFAEVV